MKKWVLIFTTTRVIASKLSGTFGVALSGLSGIIGELERADIKKRAERFISEIPGVESLDDILETDKDNFFIEYQDISTVEMKRGGLLSPTSMRFKTQERDYQFNLIDRKRFNECVDNLNSILPGKVVVK